MSKGEVFKSLADAMKVLGQRAKEKAGGLGGKVTDSLTAPHAVEEILVNSPDDSDKPVEWVWELLRKELALPIADARIVDIGSGTGESTRLIKAHGGTNVVGIDPDEGRVKRARELSDIPYFVTDVEHMPFEPKSIDAFVARWAFMYFQDHKESVDKIKTTLKDDGVLLCASWPIEGLGILVRDVLGGFIGDPAIQARLKAEDISSATTLRNYGFSDVKTFRKDFILKYRIEDALTWAKSSMLFVRIPNNRHGEVMRALEERFREEADPNGYLLRPMKIIVDVARK